MIELGRSKVRWAPKKTLFVGRKTTLTLKVTQNGKAVLNIGIATNVCVESTLRHGYFLDYWPLLITDATMQAGPLALQQATLFNVENFFGWTVQSEEFLAAVNALRS